MIQIKIKNNVIKKLENINEKQYNKEVAEQTAMNQEVAGLPGNS